LYPKTVASFSTISAAPWHGMAMKIAAISGRQFVLNTNNARIKRLPSTESESIPFNCALASHAATVAGVLSVL
jgi:hypothetical protein